MGYNKDRIRYYGDGSLGAFRRKMAMGIDQQPMWVCPKLKDALEPCDLGGL